MKVRALFLGMLFVSALPVAAGEPVGLRVRPAVAFAPAFLKVHAVVEPDADNRSLEIVADSPEFYRSSQVPLDGDQAARTTTLEFRDLPTGTYEVTAILTGARGRRGAVTQRVTVLDRGSELDVPGSRR
jgi:hypothetical protein